METLQGDLFPMDTGKVDNMMQNSMKSSNMSLGIILKTRRKKNNKYDILMSSKPSNYKNSILVGIGDNEFLKAWKHNMNNLQSWYENNNKFDGKQVFFLISAGFDGVNKDPLGTNRLSPDVFKNLTTTFQNWCKVNMPKVRIVSVLEGGYGETLPKAIVEHIRGFHCNFVN